MNDNNDDAAFVLGIDGVPWDLLRKWAKGGELPHFATIFEDGAASPLRSTTPPTTPLAWPSIATGKRPDKHGIYAFQELQSDYTRRMYTSRNRKGRALWDRLTPAVVGNVPMTYPADEIDGEIVTGMITPEIGEGFTHPPELRAEIEREIPEYRIGLEWQEYADDADRFEADIEALVSARRRLMNRLAERTDWRLFFFVYTAPDRFQHLIWDEAKILEHYRTIDEIVGDAMTYASERNATLYIVSDHGFGPISKIVQLNTLLAEEGFLARKDNSGGRGALSSLGVTKSMVLKSLERVGVTDDSLVRYLPKTIVDGVAERIPGEHGLYDVDFANTTAFAYGPGHVYVNDADRFDEGVVPRSEVESVKRSVESSLADATDPETGERVLTVSDGADLFPTDRRAPDLVADGRDGYEEKTQLSDRVFEPAGTKAAGHRPEGVFLAWGPTIGPEKRPDGATVFDVAPTILHDLGEPISESVDGRVLDVFAAGSDPAERSVQFERRGEERTVPTDHGEAGEDFDGVEDRLRGLGYLD